MKTIILLLFLIQFYSYGQRGVSVYIEPTEMSADQKRIQKINEEIRQIEKDWKTDYYELFNNNKYSPANKWTGMNKAELSNLIQKNESSLYFLQTTGLQEKCEQVNRLEKSINQYNDDNCFSINNRVKKLKNDNIWANEQLKNLGVKESTENFNKEKHRIETDGLDNEISDLDKLIADGEEELKKYSENKSSKSLDDILAETNTKKKSYKSLDDILAETNTKKKSYKSLDDILAETNTSSQSLDDILDSTSSSSSSYEIVTKNNMQGVISNSGKLLIPYKEWEIIEFKMGIAKVKLEIDSKYFCSILYTAYKEGFVDNNGEFIDGYEIDFSSDDRTAPGKLVIYVTRGKLTEAEERAIKRRKAIARRKNELKRKNCEIDANQWKKRIISNYN